MNSSIQSVRISDRNYRKIVYHCVRKLVGHYSDNETEEKKAYGVIGGKIKKDIAYIQQIIEFRNNYRNSPDISEQMNQLIKDVAIPTQTSTEERAWVASPEEIFPITEYFEEKGLDLIGTYHMHHELGDAATDLDRHLGKDTDMIMFIVHIGKDHRASMRAFYEAVNEIDIQVV
jgi:proteasome lid subunit RPN8/RPN11